MRVWVVTGINYGGEESGNFAEVLSVLDHIPSNIEMAIVKSDAVSMDPHGKGFEEYEIDAYELLTEEK